MNYKKINEINKSLHLSTNENIIGVSIAKKVINGVTTDEPSIRFSVKEKISPTSLSKKDILPRSIMVDGKTIKTDVVQVDGFTTCMLFTKNRPIDEYLREDCMDEDWLLWTNKVFDFALLGILEMEKSTNAISYDDYPDFNYDQRQRVRVLQGGLSISANTDYLDTAVSAGTLGCIAVDKDTNSLVGLTNMHVITGYDPFYTTFSSNKPITSNKFYDYAGDARTFQPGKLDICYEYNLNTFFGRNVPTGYDYRCASWEPYKPHNFYLRDFEVGTVKRYVPVYPTYVGGKEETEEITDENGNVISNVISKKTGLFNKVDAAIFAINPPSKTPGLIQEGDDARLWQSGGTHIKSWFQNGQTFPQTKQNLNSSTRPPQFATTEELDSLLVAGNLATLRSDGKRVEGPNFYITGRTSGPRGYEASVRWKLHEINQSMDINYNALHYNETWLASFENLFSLVAYGNDGYRVNIDEKFGGSKPYKCYFPAAPGDSGSAVLVDGEHFGDGSDTTPRIVGLLFAVNYTVKDPYPFSETSNTGYLTNCFTTYELNSTLQGLAFPKTAIICRIDEIAKELNIKSWNGEFIDDDGNPINFSNTDKREVIITKGGSEKKYIEKDGKKYWQVGRVNPELYDPTQDDDGNPTSVEVELERSKTLFNSRIEENATGEEAIYPHYKK